MSERPNTYMWTVICIFLIVMVSPAFAGKIIYVDEDAAGANDGSSWTDAYKYLQDALADANSADKSVVIRVARGVYRPDRNTAEPNGTGDRTATFQLINGVTLKGGYAGLGEADPNVRNIELYETILSGDLNGNDVNIIDPVDSKNEPTRAENSYHVVTGSGTNETVVLDGLTITAGNANGKFDNTVGKGGGMFNDNSRLSLTHCTFKGNSAYYGGGMFIYNSDLTITNCTFSGNSGKGMHSWESNVTLTNCTFSGNSDGGMYNWLSKVTLTNCMFSRNSGDLYGGGMENNGGSPILNNCTFFGNTSLDYGGGMFNSVSSPTIANCTFAKNTAQVGNALYVSLTSKENQYTVQLTNCILWDGSNEVWNTDDSIINITYSDVQGGFPGKGNIDSDPCFADPGYWDPNGTPDYLDDDFWVDGDYHLKSQAGRWTSASLIEPDANEGGWTKDDVTSPCIDAGDQSNPIGLESFPNGGIINMGAYGGTAEASKSYFGLPVCETIIAGDINGDCKVDFNDFVLMAANWLEDNSQ